MNQNYHGAWHRLAQPRLPFLTTVNLPDLSRIMNDPISHDLTCSAIPNKLPLDIPKFKGKAGEDPSERLTTFHLWCSSNSLHDDSIHLRLFQRTLTRPTVKWYLELPRGHSFYSMTLLWLSSITSSYPCITTLVQNSCQHFDKTKPHISRTISKSGVDRRGWLKPSYRQNFSLSGSLNCCYLTSRRMFLHPESRTRNKQFLGHNNWIWFMLNPDFCMRSYLTLCVLVSIPRSSLDHMPMALCVVCIYASYIWS